MPIVPGETSSEDEERSLLKKQKINKILVSVDLKPIFASHEGKHTAHCPKEIQMDPLVRHDGFTGQ